MSTDLLVITAILVRVSEQARIHEEETNLRADKRYPVHAGVQWARRDSDTGVFGKQADGWARDMSHTGISLLVEEHVEPGTTIDIDLEGLEAPGHFVAGRVVRCFQLLTNVYEIGVCFLED